MNREAERSVLGAALKSAEAHTLARTELVAEDFAVTEHQIIFSAMCKVFDKGLNLDPITLADELGAMLAEVGGIPYLTGLVIDTVTAANVEHHIQIVKELSRRRHFLTAIKEITERMESGEDFDFLQETVIASDKAKEDASSTVQLVGDHVLEALAELTEGKQKGLSTGFLVLDQTLGGLNKGHVCVVAGRPSMGKTSFAANIATNVAERGLTVAFFSLEQPRNDIAKRMLVSTSGCSEYDIHAGNTRQIERLSARIDAISKWNMSIFDNAYSIEKIREKCYSLKRRTKALDLIVIDYLGLIKARQKKNGTREQEVAELSRTLKLLAREMDCPILLLSQLSRAPEQRTDHKPILADLRESGAIEQDADEVIFLYRPWVYDHNANPNEAAIIVAKNRNGRTGEIDAEWDGEHFKYTDFVLEEIPEPQQQEWEDL